MAYQIAQGQTALVNPDTAQQDTGWSISGMYATHVNCNAGTMVALNNFGLVVGRSYIFTYTIDSRTSGTVKLIAGTTNGASQNSNTVVTETLTVAGTPYLSFYSDGNLRISNLKFYDAVTGLQPGTTISFNEKENKWGAEWSFISEMSVRFIDKLFTFSEGQLWRHNNNPTHGSFYGVTYPCQVTFVSNQEFRKEKIWMNMRLDSRGEWSAPVITTPESDQFPNGMESRIKAANFKRIDGKKWASIMRDMNDPNFVSISDPAVRHLQALFNGRAMQGGWLMIEMQNDDTTYAELSSVEVYYVDTMRAF